MRLGFKIAARYALAVTTVAIATGLRLLLERSIGPMPLFVTWYPAVLLVATVAGGGPGIATTLLAASVADYWFIAPAGFGIVSANDAVATGIFTTTGLFLSVLAERLRRLRWAEAVNVTQERELALLNMGNLMILDLNHRIVRWSEGNHRLYGFAAHEAQGQLSLDLLQTHSIDPSEPSQADLMEKDYWEGDVVRRTRDGTLLSLTLLRALRRDEHGAPQTILEVSTDITARKAAEETVRQLNVELTQRTTDIQNANEALKASRLAAINLMEDAIEARHEAEQTLAELGKSREDLNRAQAVAHTGSWRLDVRKNELLWSDESWRIFGVPEGTPLTYETFLSTIHPDDREYVDTRWAAALSGEPYDIEHRIVVDDMIKWVRERAELEFDAQGILRGGFGTTQDITERKRTEDAILRAKEEWERTFDTVPDLISILDRDHGILRVNKAMADSMGLTPDQCVGQKCYRCVHGAHGAPALCPHVLTLSDGQEHTAEIHEESLGGNFLVTTTPLMDENGRQIGTVHVARDITERKRREAQLHQLNRTLNALSHSAQALMHATSEAQFLETACRIVVQDCGYALVWIGFAADDDDRSILPIAHAGFDDGYLDTLQLTWADEERGRGPTGTAIRTGKACRCLNMLTDPAFLPWREQAIQRGYASSLALPLIEAGNPFGALTIYARDPVGFSDEQVALLGDLANDFAQGIASLRTRYARERAEQAVRENEERYRTLFSTMTEGFALHEIICDRAGKPCDYRFLDINPAFEALTGLTRAQVIGKTLLEVMPDTEPIWIERYGRVALTGESDHFEQTNAALGRHYEVNAYRTAPGRFAVIFDDVTELRAMQRREKEDAVRLVWGQSAIDTIHAMLDGVVLLELDGTITSINPAVERMTDLDGGSVVGRNIAALLPQFVEQTDLRKARLGLAILRRGGMPELLPPIFLKRHDGRTIHVLPSLSLMEAPEGGRRVAVLTLKNVTELHEATHRLEQSERKYRELIENANSIIMRVTPDHTITFFNEYAQNFFGYAADEVLGRNVVGTIAPETDSEGRDLRLMFREIAMAPELHTINENENTSKDGRRVWVHWSNRAIRNDQGAVVEILCVGTDITQRREMEAKARHYQQRLRDLTKRLAAAEEEDRWRISRYIHDTIIQNLSLSSIHLASMTQPLTDAPLAKETRKLRQVRTLIDEAIDECRMVMSDLTPALLYELGLIPALNDLAQQLSMKHGARIVVEGDGQEQAVSPSLRGLLFESTRELIMNALKHAGPCEIHIAVSSHDRDLIIRVNDNGKGFDLGRTDVLPGHQGGFGLFSIRQRVEGLGGQLEIESVCGKGTTMTIRVPLGQEDTTA